MLGSAHSAGTHPGSTALLNAGPSTSNGSSHSGEEELAVAVGLYAVPWTLDPVDVIQGRVAVVVHATAEVDQTCGPFDERGQHVGRQHIHGEDAGVAVVGRDAFAVDIDPGVVDHRVEDTMRVCLVGDAANFGRIREVPDHDTCGTADEIAEFIGTFRRSGVDHDLVAVIEECLRCDSP